MEIERFVVIKVGTKTMTDHYRFYNVCEFKGHIV